MARQCRVGRLGRLVCLTCLVCLLPFISPAEASFGDLQLTGHMIQDINYSKEKVGYLEGLLNTCRAKVTAVEARVSELEIDAKESLRSREIELETMIKMMMESTNMMNDLRKDLLEKTANCI
jgi:hypothetical protein